MTLVLSGVKMCFRHNYCESQTYIKAAFQNSFGTLIYAQPSYQNKD